MRLGDDCSNASFIHYKLTYEKKKAWVTTINKRDEWGRVEIMVQLLAHKVLNQEPEDFGYLAITSILTTLGHIERLLTGEAVEPEGLTYRELNVVSLYRDTLNLLLLVEEAGLNQEEDPSTTISEMIDLVNSLKMNLLKVLTKQG